MQLLTNILLMAPQQGQKGFDFSTLFLIGGVFIVLYFFMIRPQQKKAKDAKSFLDGLQKGDKIVTVAGIHGRLAKLNENGTVEVEIDTNVKVVMERSGISAEYTKAIQEKK